MTADPERMTITVKEAAQMLGVDPRTVTSALSTRGGNIPARAVGRRVVIPRASFLAWLSGDTKDAESPHGESRESEVAAIVRTKLIELLGTLGASESPRAPQ
ncbi:hypothetical protein GCM10023065_02980 [Microbacterium laevaniformans]|uniref:Helix-turn-helix domain protein n=1 Tax=Microbacterium laevaniformans TaxID=36807 RepID=A0A150HHX3_9MICO|nr:helix-turn-helix domain-containing protein [Microbacterium laevaniformans]KXZ61645.1 Helix-turn-helix domain protein [Microbacterium laevaniformans]MBM7754184.1 excisionase family DNA binding protein [Microbacterium laevaniformans]GLJ65248.1 hypothetical protein GCM10017578_21370 [Microbacterium laevaniformans]